MKLFIDNKIRKIYKKDNIYYYKKNKQQFDVSYLFKKNGELKKKYIKLNTLKKNRIIKGGTLTNLTSEYLKEYEKRINSLKYETQQEELATIQQTLIVLRNILKNREKIENNNLITSKLRIIISNLEQKEKIILEQMEKEIKIISNFTKEKEIEIIPKSEYNLENLENIISKIGETQQSQQSRPPSASSVSSSESESRPPTPPLPTPPPPATPPPATPPATPSKYSPYPPQMAYPTSNGIPPPPPRTAPPRRQDPQHLAPAQGGCSKLVSKVKKMSIK